MCRNTETLGLPGVTRCMRAFDTVDVSHVSYVIHACRMHLAEWIRMAEGVCVHCSKAHALVSLNI